MNITQLELMESESFEEAGLRTTTSAEANGGDYEYEQDCATKHDEEEVVQKSSGCNVVYAYLNEVKHWPILSRDEEYSYAKVYYEAELEKSALLQQWVRIFQGSVLSRQLFSRKAGKMDETIAAGAQKCLHIIDTISVILEKIEALEKHVLQADTSIYKKKKLEAEKSQLVDDLDHYSKKIELFKLYRSGAVRSLYPFLKARIKIGTRRELIAVLKRYSEVGRESQEAKERLISSNLRLVVGIAKKYANRGLSLPDLIQEGNIGLIRAIEKFDYRLGNRLSTYASWWIRQTVIRAIEEKSSTIRVPIYINEKIKKILRNSMDEASQTDVAEEALNDSDNLYFALQLTKDPISLETPFSDDGSNLHECIPDRTPASAVEQIETNQLNDITDRLLKGLSQRDESILRMRFGVGDEAEHTLEEIGEKFKLSRERIRQIETSALRRIRVSGESGELRAFLCDEAV